MATPTPRAIVAKVRTFVRRHDVLRPGPLVLAVSGGTDSTALALVMRELADDLGLTLHVAHFDHGMRPRDAAADAHFVAGLADRIGATLRLGRADGPLRSEDAARRARYAFLRRAAAHAGASLIATGHTGDDQAETVLLHLARGAGIAGAAGMRPLRDGVARPLLSLSRAETSAICRAAGIVPLEDPSNGSLVFARNRVRLRVLPELETVNPRVREALARFALAAADAEAALERAVAATVPGDGGELDLASLPASRALRERALASAYRRATGVTLAARHRSALVDLAATTRGTKRIDLPGAAALREYGALRIVADADRGPTTHAGEARRATPAGDKGRLARRDDDRPIARGDAEEPPARGDDRRPLTRGDDPRPLTRGNTMEWPGWRIALDVSTDGLPFSGAVDAATAGRLVIRGRRPGDRVSQRGKLQDVFVDAKVPARLRDGWPLVVAGDTVLWVPGVTTPPRTGRITLAAGPVGDHLDLAAVLGHSGRGGRVASKSDARQPGGKRGRR